MSASVCMSGTVWFVDIILIVQFLCCMCLYCGVVCYYIVFFFLMIRRPPRSTLDRSSAASDVYKRQALKKADRGFSFQAVDSSNGHRLITHPDTFGVGSTDLQAASVKFGVQCEPRKLSLIHISEPTRPY
mgnify:CR=1 FL=1